MPIPNLRLGRSLELFFIDNRADGMLTAEVFNWTGHVLVAPRTQIGDALRRREADYSGVYLLIGENDQGPLAYIGEGEIISDRIRNHDSHKDWWSKAIMITTGANNLNKAHIRYLEARLIQDALEIGRMRLENATIPSRPGLNESAISNMEGFLEHIFLVLPAIGVDMFVRRTRSLEIVGESNKATPSSDLSDGSKITFETSVQREGIKATARLVNGEFVIEAGSTARHEWIGSGTHNYKQLFEELVKTGVLTEEGNIRRFTQSYAFSSPSAAGAIVAGRSCNGPSAWIVRGSGETYREWEQRTIRV